MVALLSKHTITLAPRTFATSNLIHETIRIKSGAWDDAGAGASNANAGKDLFLVFSQY